MGGVEKQSNIQDETLNPQDFKDFIFNKFGENFSVTTTLEVLWR